MISVITYGRNDSHGYNLHRRAATSLNCIAEMLDDPDDEIMFVDYNTPDDFITFPEAIVDTLTAKCKKLMKIVRVRPRHHAQRFKAETDLVALEPVSRNVGFRYSNPKNRWMLCTNTDMMFLPHAPYKSLSDIARTLSDGFYELPRYELPDFFWENLDRMDPRGNLEKVSRWGARYHVNEIIEKDREILYDGPGDFQLFLRKDIFDAHGFDERFNRGWHMDSNLCKRFYIKYGTMSTLVDRLSGWHCNHTRSQTIAHSSGRQNNDIVDGVTQVVRVDLPHQKEGWGLQGEELETFTLCDARTDALFGAMDRILPHPMVNMYRQPFITSDAIECPPEHLKPYIVEVLYTFHRNSVIGYFGFDAVQFRAFYDVWKALGFKGPLYIVGPKRDTDFSALVAPDDLPHIRLVEADERCDLFVGDYHVIDPADAKESIDDNRREIAILNQLIALERVRAEKKTHVLRKFIMLNGVQWPVCNVLARYTNMQENPFGTRIRHGVVAPFKKREKI